MSCYAKSSRNQEDVFISVSRQRLSMRSAEQCDACGRAIVRETVEVISEALERLDEKI